MDAGENFRAIVASDDKMKARWEAVSDKVIADTSSLLGVTLSREDVMALPSARLAVLTDDALSDSFLNEVHKLETVKEQQRRAELREALEQGDEEAHSALNRLPPHIRMARARDLGLTGAAPTPAPSSVADEATLLRRLLTLSPAERLARAREWGLA